MSLLQLLFVIVSLIFFLFSIDAFERKKVNLLHFLAFSLGLLFILAVSFFPSLLDKFGDIIGARGADAIVYISIILLAYFYFELLHKITRNTYNLSRMVSQEAIKSFEKENGPNSVSWKVNLEDNQNPDPKTNFVFLIRAHNEEDTIGGVIDEITKKGFKKIVIVNDGSTDQTEEIVKKKQKSYSSSIIVLISHSINRGGGAANKTGFAFLRKYGDIFNAERIITYDADGQMNIEDTDKFIEKTQENSCDIILGSRFIRGGESKNMPLSRRIILFGSVAITYIFNGVFVSDPHNGFRAIKLPVLKKIKITSDDMTYASEILDEIRNLKLNFLEVPVKIKYTEYSIKKGQKTSNAFKILFELIYKKFFFK